MSNNATKNRVGRPPLTLNATTWAAVTNALAVQSDLSELAEIAECSVPTMRKLLADKYGNRVQFTRGRNGGVSLVAARGRKSKA